MPDMMRDGWITLPTDPALAPWLAAALPRALEAVADPAQRARGLDCEQTWFVGVDALANDPDGAVDGVPLVGEARRHADALFGRLPLHRAQVSVVWPGYPRPRQNESETAFRYRIKRDAAHLDGLLAEGPERRRFIREPHAWILGLPLTAHPAGASPLVVWRGSHHVLRRALLRRCAGHAPESWADLDVTSAYTAARAEVFDTCERVKLHAMPGQAYLLHRQILHGVAPWGAGVEAGPDGRMLAYFRPVLPGGAAQWLLAE